MNHSAHALDNLLQVHPEIRTGGLRDLLERIDGEADLSVLAAEFGRKFHPTAARWDRDSRTLHLYEISSSEAFPDGTFDAIREFAERLHDGAGCFTAIWIADGDGHDPMKVWDVRDELIWVR